MMELDKLDRKHTEINLYKIDISPYNEHSIFIDRILDTTPKIKHNLLSIAKILRISPLREWIAYTDGSLQRFEEHNIIQTK